VQTIVTIQQKATVKRLTTVLNIGVVGYGYWGPNLVRNFAETPGINLAAVSDLDAKKLEVVRKRFPAVKTTQCYQDLLDDPNIDAIAVATPVNTHFALGMAVLKAGKHLWLEKPMTETSDEARQLVAEAEKRKLVLLVDHTFIYTGAVRKISEVIRAGELGNTLYYDSTRINLGLFQRDVSVISDLAVHDFAILDFLLGEQPAVVSASGINHFPGTPENLAYLTLFYDSGVIAHLNVSWLAPVKIRSLLIGGSQKMIVYDDLEPSEKVKIYDKGVSFTDDPAQIQEMRVGYRTGDMWAPKLANVEALRAAAENFVDCIENSRVPETDGRLGQRVVEVIEAATSSMRGKYETVRFPKRSAA
jgi:predicted dehydrogenase